MSYLQIPLAITYVCPFCGEAILLSLASKAMIPTMNPVYTYLGEHCHAHQAVSIKVDEAHAQYSDAIRELRPDEG